MRTVADNLSAHRSGLLWGPSGTLWDRLGLLRTTRWPLGTPVGPLGTPLGMLGTVWGPSVYDPYYQRPIKGQGAHFLAI